MYTLKDLSKHTAEFIRVFDASLDMRLWLTLLEEEFTELENAIANEPKENVLKEAADFLYVFAPCIVIGEALQFHNMIPEKERLQFDALAKRYEEVMPYLEKTFSDTVILEALKRVHESNMSKLGDDGKPIRREDGKILKGPNYKAPDLSDLVSN